MKPVHITDFVLPFVILFSVAAHAQDDADEKGMRQKAEQYFSRGEMLFQSGDFARAAEAFLLAYETSPHPAVLLNAALSYERAGNLPQAIQIYQQYLAIIEDRGDTDTDAEARMEALNAKVGKIAISAICNKEKCRILVDGMDRGEAPVAVTVMPGSHKIEAMEAGELVAIKYLLIGPGDVLTADLKAEEMPPEDEPQAKKPEEEVKPAQPVPEESKKKVKLKAPFWISSGLTLASGGAALGVYLSVYFTDQQDFNDAKDAGDFDKAKEVRDKAMNKQLASQILVGVAGGAAVAAVVFAIINVKSSKREEPDDTGQVSLFLVPGPGIGVDVRF